MKTNPIRKGILIGSLVGILCLSWVWSLLLSRFIDTENHENRARIECPELTPETYETFSRDFDLFLNDHLPFRNQLVTLNSMIDYFIFHQSSSDNVMVGKDHWLFYTSVSDGDALASYAGADLLSEEELKALADNCEKTRKALEEMGKEFVIFIAPNKERIYPQHMPDRFGPPAENYRTLQVVQYLREHTDVRVVYPCDELYEAACTLEEPLYYPTDTHWNVLGGYIGSRALLAELGIEYPSLPGPETTIVQKAPHTGDLTRLLHLEGLIPAEDYLYRVDGYNRHQMETLKNTEHLIRTKAKGADKRKLFVCRDSFAAAMSGILGTAFNRTYLLHRDVYTYSDFVKQDPDIFVYETVERYTDRLASFDLFSEEPFLKK